MIPNHSLIKLIVKAEKPVTKKFVVRPLSARPNLSPVAARLRLLTRSRRAALPS